MNESTVVAVVVGLIGVLGGAGFWGFLISRKEAPIKKRDADVAVAHTSQQMALALAEDLRTDLGRLRGDVDTERKAREELGAQVAELRDKVGKQDRTIQALRHAVRTFQDAWHHLTANWATIRLLENPPQEPRVSIYETEAT